MATFLQLVHDLERESGTVERAARLTSVAQAQTAEDRHEDMVGWIVEAWRIIQLMRSDWRWMRKEFDHATVINQARYTPSDLGITTFSHWPFDSLISRNFSLYDPAQRAEERPIRMLDFNSWKARYDRGVHDAQIPSELSIDYDNRVCLGPTPDKAYVLRGEYYRTPQILAADSDVPIMPAQHHGMIVWRAMMLLGDHDESPTAVATGQAKFNTLFRNLVEQTMERPYI
jgi:hypothetical protein